MDRRDGGQATVELALVLPLVVTMLLMVLQVALVARDQILVVHAAREAAREAAVDPRPSAIRLAARRAAKGLKLEALRTETSTQGGMTSIVIVRVHYRSATDVVLVGPLLPAVDLGAKAAMRVESSRGAQE